MPMHSTIPCMPVVSFRVPQQAIDALQRAGKKPADVARAAVEELARQEDVDAQFRWLKEHALPWDGTDVVAEIRAMRDERTDELMRRIRPPTGQTKAARAKATG